MVKATTDRDHNGEWILKKSTCKINNYDGAEVCVSRKHDSSRITVTVRAASILDLRAAHLIRSVDEFVRRYKAAHVIIDLGRTHRIHDSGLAMLILLKKKLGKQVKKIKLVNTGNIQRSNLAYLPKAFEVN